MSTRATLPSRPSTPAAALAAADRAVLRARSARRSRWFRVLVAVLGLVLIAAMIWTACFSSLLAVRHVRVVGAERASVAEVAAAARVPLGESLVLLDTDAVAERIRALAPVAAVTVQRRPLHSVRLVVRERVPVLVVESGPGAAQLVDATGTAFAPEDASGAGLPRVRSSAQVVGPALLRAVLTMLLDLPASAREDVEVIRVESVHDLIVELTDRRRVIWGDDSRGDFKARVLTVLMQRPGRVYDVSTPEAPTISRR